MNPAAALGRLLNEGISVLDGSSYTGCSRELSDAEAEALGVEQGLVIGMFIRP
jgi:hypothetical protein